MARLNEPARPAAADTASANDALESLKRRFLRQNREIARVNQNQSLKIRSLETQLSQFVAENCQLRAEGNQLRIALDEARATRTLQHVETVRKQLQDKLKEVEGLVGSLEDVGKKRTSTGRRQSEVAQKSPSHRRSSCNTLALPQRGEIEGWLPTIVEGKHFPRRTMEYVESVREPSANIDKSSSAEVSTLVDQASDSPELGPPPRTFIDRRISLDEDQEPAQEESEKVELPDFPAVNYETRRRRISRRDSSLVSALDLSPYKDDPRTSDLLSSQPVRAGAKRKLDASDRPSNEQQSAAKEADTLTFRRKRDEASSKVATVNSSPVRKALAPKPVNTDPVVISPRKQTVQGGEKEKPDKKTVPAKPRERRLRGEAQPVLDVPAMSEPPVVTTDIPLDTIKLEPKTPAALDIFSPVSTQPSEFRPEGRSGTPPPTTGEVAGARGSRRARANVSYAEPSLNTKMRRPGKELVDAVVDRRSSTVAAIKREDSEAPSGASTEGPKRTVLLSRDGRSISGTTAATRTAIAEEGARPEPGSPLGDRSTAGRSSSGGTTQSSETTPAETTKNAQTSGQQQLRDIMATAPKEGLGSLEDAMNNLDVYDVQDSPPPNEAVKKNPVGIDQVRPRSQNSIRPSTAGSSRLTTTSSMHKLGQLDTTSSSRVRASRRQSLAHLTPTDTNLASDVRPKSSIGTATITSSRSDLARRPAATLEEKDRKSTVGRRRSMML